MIEDAVHIKFNNADYFLLSGNCLMMSYGDSYDNEEEDEVLGIVKRVSGEFANKIVINRDSIDVVSMMYDSNKMYGNDRYKYSIDVVAKGDTSHFMTASSEEAHNLYRQLMLWRFNIDIGQIERLAKG